jgi:hypothetical protein
MVAGTLSKLGSSRKVIPLGVFLEHLHIPSVKMVDPKNPELASSPIMAVLPANPPWSESYLKMKSNGGKSSVEQRHIPSLMANSTSKVLQEYS